MTQNDFLIIVYIFIGYTKKVDLGHSGESGI